MKVIPIRGFFLNGSGHFCLMRDIMCPTMGDPMEKILNLQKQLLPDLLQTMQKRYDILRHIQLMQPVGRRSLTFELQTTERVLRAEVDFLRAQGLVAVGSAGMELTQEGIDLLSEMEPLMKELFGLNQLEAELKAFLGVKHVVIVPGDADASDWVKKEMGRAGARYLKQQAAPEQIVAVSGGTTMLAVAEMMMPTPAFKQTTFVPTRGGVGEAVELEANYIASLMAKRTGGTYRMLHIPDELSDEAYQTLQKEPHIREVLDLLRSARMVVHGIGDAKTMAIRRKSSAEVLAKLEAGKAVGESFGYYFDRDGQIVHRVRTLGLDLEGLERVEQKVAVAGGASKAEAIVAVCSLVSQDTLITDEGAARAILKNAIVHQE
ncbi:central glycolytic genes regulator [Laceyella sediminis]|uniref:Central glycolytic genes regulator n=2 Tax=Thermoactinomycetaceae TaxID=186824 RepID=A0ABX5ETQ6_9BACL|nr:central glycolytic genes regulator [Laceyella sediminis]